jgi:hypothetical protein
MMRGWIRGIFGKENKPIDEEGAIYSAIVNHLAEGIFYTRQNALTIFREKLSNITASENMKPTELAVFQRVGLHNGLGKAANELISEARQVIDSKYRQKIAELGIQKEVEELIDQEVTQGLSKVMDEADEILRNHLPGLEKADQIWRRNK